MVVIQIGTLTNNGLFFYEKYATKKSVLEAVKNKQTLEVWNNSTDTTIFINTELIPIIQVYEIEEE